MRGGKQTVIGLRASQSVVSRLLYSLRRARPESVEGISRQASRRVCHYSPFSKLTAPSGEPSVLTTGRPKRTSRSPREILRKLRMTAFGAPFSLLRPSAHRCGGKQASPRSYNTLARPKRATASPLRMVSCPFQVAIRMSENSPQINQLHRTHGFHGLARMKPIRVHSCYPWLLG